MVADLVLFCRSVVSFSGIRESAGGLCRRILGIHVPFTHHIPALLVCKHLYFSMSSGSFFGSCGTENVQEAIADLHCCAYDFVFQSLENFSSHVNASG